MADDDRWGHILQSIKDLQDSVIAAQQQASLEGSTQESHGEAQSDQEKAVLEDDDI